MIILWFPMVSYGLPMVFPWVSSHVPMVSHGFPSSPHVPTMSPRLRHEVLSSRQVAGHGVVFDEALDLAPGKGARNGELKVSMVYLWYIYIYIYGVYYSLY